MITPQFLINEIPLEKTFSPSSLNNEPSPQKNSDLMLRQPSGVSGVSSFSTQD